MSAQIDWMDFPHIDIVTEPLTDEAFFSRYGSERGLPLLFKGLGTTWPSHSGWSLEMFNEKYGSQQIEAVRLRRKGNELERTTVTMALGEYLDYLKSPEQHEPLHLTDWAISAEMELDLQIPSYFDSWHLALPREMQPRLGRCSISPTGSGFPMQQSVMGTGAFNVAITGRKAWVFFAPDQDAAMYGGRVDAFNPDLDTFPDYAKTTGYKCIQEPGDVVFAPSNWWHQVSNQLGGISYTGNFINHGNHAHVRRALMLNREMRQRATLFEVDCGSIAPVA
ncbi:cupin-like domain-containing protein [Denitromonas iodatirespirans]|uniref:Cupin-like domain-containing protein n=1 Tax=Denitromonas iodatirespirans TaxID=2795389 RepID=A0A944HAC4_DENI1|nr:cupin-like domain-containing protein [Denitromonas iodatirespirans]MBT0964149.1 cupin-like domain-containing protein [Denitromonas iodatirespirans]